MILVLAGSSLGPDVQAEKDVEAIVEKT